MAESSCKDALQFKSPLRVVVKFLRQSRDRKTGKYRSLKREFDQMRRELNRREKELEAREIEIAEWKAKYRSLECEHYSQTRAATINLPVDPPIGHHGFGARMVTLSITLARVVGFRSAARVMKIVFGWLGWNVRVPHFTAIRIWMQRLGVAMLQEPLEKADDWIWMADHSNQIGQEKILVVLGIRASNMPPAGTALKHQDMRVLAVRPGKSWKREDVAAVYAELAERHGAPRAILSDGAVELRESAEVLKKQRPDGITLQDFKHKAANHLEASVGKSERFAQFTGLVGTTRSVIQQTELAHLTPPGLKTKARFMNLGPLLEWAMMILWLLKNPEAKSRRGINPQRLESKLGWVRSFEQDLTTWDECQKVINQGLEVINTQGVFRGAADQLRRIIGGDLKQSLSRQLADRLIAFVSDAEQQVKEGERLPLSTEILESSFGLYKRLERQHSKGGFTSLVATFAGLLTKPNPAMIKEKFSKVSTKDVQRWVKTHLDTTLTSKRASLYQEMKKSTGRGMKPKAGRAKKTATRC